MHSLIPALLLALLQAVNTPLQSQSFNWFIERLNALPTAERQAVADSFMQSAGRFPYTEADTVAHFVFDQSAASVAVAGDHTGWEPDRPMTRVDGTTFWYLTEVFPSDARLDYKYVVNGFNWILDPKNPHTCMGGFGPNSELRMPHYTFPQEIAYNPAIPHGTLTDTLFYSPALQNSRTVKVYLPPGYPAGRDAYPVIVFHDGPEYFSLGNAVNILDNLVAGSLMAPVIALFVPPVNRTEEYAGNRMDQFTTFIVSELMPAIDSRYKTSRDPSLRAMAGASNGGNIALYISMRHPEAFGLVAAQSSNIIPVITDTFTQSHRLPLNVYLDIGMYDIPFLVPVVEGFRSILADKGYPHEFHRWSEGHSWGSWKGHLRLPLVRFFPVTAGTTEPPAGSPGKLHQNRPNPFRGQTVIPCSAIPGENIELTLFDSAGRKLGAIFSGRTEQPMKISYIHRHPPGSYILTLTSGKGYRESILITAE